jgi:hypothetical protein
LIAVGYLQGFRDVEPWFVHLGDPKDVLGEIRRLGRDFRSYDRGFSQNRS